MRTRPDDPTLPPAEVCSWCGEFASDADRDRADRGAKLSHGMCPACEYGDAVGEAEYDDRNHEA